MLRHWSTVALEFEAKVGTEDALGTECQTLVRHWSCTGHSVQGRVELLAIGVPAISVTLQFPVRHCLHPGDAARPKR